MFMKMNAKVLLGLLLLCSFPFSQGYAQTKLESIKENSSKKVRNNSMANSQNDAGANHYELFKNRRRIMYDEYIPRTISPDVAAFMKVNCIPVSNYTGRTKVEIPLYTISDGQISIPIYLSYNTSGIKVDDLASSVGLNWTLNAGGVISKIIRGKEDCSYKYDNNNIKSVGWLLKKNVLSKLNLDNSNGSWGGVTEDGTFDTSGCMNNDYEPDLFIGSAPNLDVKFVLDLDHKPFEFLRSGNRINTVCM